MKASDKQAPRVDLTAAKGVQLVNALTVDVEDYFQVQAFEGRFPRSRWDEIPCRIGANIEQLLALFAKENVRATFFTLGWIAERYPDMVRRIAAEGHELASHGYDHKRVDELPPSAFRDDIRRAKRTIEDITGKSVIGYRAPTFSISARNDWAYKILEDQGYYYSSSSYPIRHDLYGDAAGLRRPFQPGSGTVWEFPLSTRRLLGQNIPAAGGGYFRLFPYQISLMNLRHINDVECAPCIFYCHPWEIDANQPRVSGITKRTRLRHYMNLKAMPVRLARLLQDLRWDRMDVVYANCIGSVASRVAAEAKA